MKKILFVFTLVVFCFFLTVVLADDSALKVGNYVIETVDSDEFDGNVRYSVGIYGGKPPYSCLIHLLDEKSQILFSEFDFSYEDRVFGLAYISKPGNYTISVEVTDSAGQTVNTQAKDFLYLHYDDIRSGYFYSQKKTDATFWIVVSILFFFSILIFFFYLRRKRYSQNIRYILFETYRWPSLISYLLSLVWSFVIALKYHVSVQFIVIIPWPKLQGYGLFTLRGLLIAAQENIFFTLAVSGIILFIFFLRFFLSKKKKDIFISFFLQLPFSLFLAIFSGILIAPFLVTLIFLFPFLLLFGFLSSSTEISFPRKFATNISSFINFGDKNEVFEDEHGEFIIKGFEIIYLHNSELNKNELEDDQGTRFNKSYTY